MNVAQLMREISAALAICLIVWFAFDIVAAVFWALVESWRSVLALLAAVGAFLLVTGR